MIREILFFFFCAYCFLFHLLFTGGPHGHVHPFSDEDASIETLSHCSSFSDTASVADEGLFVCVQLVVSYIVGQLIE